MAQPGGTRSQTSPTGRPGSDRLVEPHQRRCRKPHRLELIVENGSGQNQAELLKSRIVADEHHARLWRVELPEPLENSVRILVIEDLVELNVRIRQCRHDDLRGLACPRGRRTENEIRQDLQGFRSK